MERVHDESGQPVKQVGLSTEGLVALWRTKGRTLNWPDGIRWDTPATSRVALACLTGVDLQSALRQLAEERFNETATASEFERDIDTLAICIQEYRVRTVRKDELINAAGEAVRWIIARDSALAQLIDPTTSLRTRTAFLADLTNPSLQDSTIYIWTARWPTNMSTWRQSATRMAVAALVLPHLRTEESATYIGPHCLTVLVLSTSRGLELEKILRQDAELNTFDATVLRRPAGPLDTWVEWLVDSFPELLDSPLP